MICAHCELSSLACQCDKPGTLSSVEIGDDVRRLSEDLSPWPISNERAWYIINQHLQVKRAALKHESRIANEYSKRVQSAIRYITDYMDIRDYDIDKVLRILDGKERHGEEVKGSGS